MSEFAGNVGGSCHPRVVNGRTAFPKVDTSKTLDKGKLAKRVAAVEAHLENHPGDGLSRLHLNKMKEKL